MIYSTPGMRYSVATWLSMVAGIFLLVFSCKKSEERKCVKSNGKITSEIRSSTPFDFIFLEDEINAVITQDTFYSIEVKAPANLIYFAETKIEGNQLRIKNLNKCNFLRNYNYEITVYITVKELNNIHFTGSGKISTTNVIISREFTLDCWGAGGSVNIAIDAKTSHSNLHTGTADVVIYGNSGVSYVYSTGAGYLYLQNLKSGYSFVRNNSTGDIHLNVEKELEVEIFSLGSIYYSGNPYKIVTDIRGKGELIKN